VGLISAVISPAGPAAAERHLLHFRLKKASDKRNFTCIFRKNTRKFEKLTAVNVNAFTARLYKFWLNQAVKYDFTADFTGTGNRS